jgi:hypothetical protein
VDDIAREVIKRLKEGKYTKWLFSLGLDGCPESPFTPERNTATGFSGVNGFLATKKNANKKKRGPLPGFNNHL